MRRQPSAPSACDVCGRTADLVPGELVRGPVAELVREEHPAFGADSHICLADLNRYRARYVQRVLEEERGELTRLEEEVVRRLGQQGLVAADLNVEHDRRLTLGERVADRVATVGGSWGFVVAFFLFLAGWIGLNSALLLGRPFDPYPYILLNLMLSCLAAIQAPIIMMSQNRQEAKDRLRAEHDYRVNLKAELEIRLLGERVDRLLSHQWRRLLEIQQIQVELMEQLGEGRPPGKRRKP